MDRVVDDSQADQLEWVPDSQVQGNVSDEHLSFGTREVMSSIIAIVSSLVILIIENEKDHVDWRAGPHISSDLPEEHFANPSRRHMVTWLDFMEQNLNILRLLHLQFESTPMRRIMSPWYYKPRTIEWFYLYIDWSPTRDPERFRLFFRISPEMFFSICDLVRPDMLSHAPETFHSLPNRYLLVERQVAVAIRCLATGDSYLGIRELFGLSKSTTIKVTWKFCQSFNRRARHFMRWPEGHSMDEVKVGFQQRWGFPNCCGAIDCTHFIIELPGKEMSSAYYGWKHNLSVSMQAIVDSQCKFLDVMIGTPGSVQDSRVLRTSFLYHNVVYDRSKLNGPELVTANGYRLREYLLGDAGYPLYNWLIVPFTRGLSEPTDMFNHNHSSARMCVERSFRRLKGMWRVLSRKIFRPKIEWLVSTIFTCVLLHNMCIERGEEVAPQVYNDATPHPEGYGIRNRRNQEMFAGGQQAREALQSTIHANWAR